MKNSHKKIFNFMYFNRASLNISAIFLILSILVIIVHGFNIGLDFTGGTIIELKLTNKLSNISKIYDNLKNAGFKNLKIQKYGGNYDFLIRTTSVFQKDNLTKEFDKNILNIIQKTIDEKIILKRIEFIGSNVGRDIGYSYGIALLLAIVLILLYISARFSWKIALSIILAVIHDIIIVLGILSLFNIEIDATIIASLMLTMAYSLNDSVVVFDRIRENFNKIKHIKNSYDLFNISLNQVFNRTLVTSFTTFTVVLILFIFGGDILRGFSITLLIGIITGTISSIYVASALSLIFGARNKILLEDKKEIENI